MDFLNPTIRIEKEKEPKSNLKFQEYEIKKSKQIFRFFNFLFQKKEKSMLDNFFILLKNLDLIQYQNLNILEKQNFHKSISNNFQFKIDQLFLFKIFLIELFFSILKSFEKISKNYFVFFLKILKNFFLIVINSSKKKTY